MSKIAPPFLLIDAGNTRLKWALAEFSGSIRVAGDIDTKKQATSAWIKALARKYPSQNVVLSSVVPRLLPAFRRAFAGRLVEMNALMPELGFGFDYPKPSELGADRLAAAVAAHTDKKYPVIIIACGTATAFTVLDAKGRLSGGVIAPGLQTQLAALTGATAQLPTTKLGAVRSGLARSTQEAIRNGVMLNFLGGVKEIVGRLSEELGTKATLLLTGGNCGYLIEESKSKIGSRRPPLQLKLRPLLVFEGLHIIGLRHFAPTT